MAKRQPNIGLADLHMAERFGGFQPDDVRRLKQLKKLVDQRDLEIEVMKEIAAKNDERAGPPMLLDWLNFEKRC